jgi:hypothetical protein
LTKLKDELSYLGSKSSITICGEGTELSPEHGESVTCVCV